MPTTSDGFTTRSYSETFELAMVCARNARFSGNKDVARELWKMAQEYQAESANSMMAGSLISATHLGS